MSATSRPYGYDERQYGSPGFDLPVGRLSRTPHGEFPEYHTSADDLDFVRPERSPTPSARCSTSSTCSRATGRYRNLFPEGEPQLGRRGLYPSVGGESAADDVMAMLWVLNLSDGGTSLLDIAERSGLPFAAVRQAVERLEAAAVVEPA